MKRIRALHLALLLALVALPAAAQGEAELTLRVRKVFGYRGGDRLQGKFTLSVEGPDDLIRVTYLLDGEVLGEVGEPPFSFSFNTGEHSLGRHTLQAVGTTAVGESVESELRSFEFVSAEAGWQAATDLLIPIVIGALALTALGVLGPVLLGLRGRGFRLGEYGPAGGAVCPRCRMPYSRRVLSPNLLLGKLERCPHCGKWAVVPRAEPEALHQAETRFKAEGEQGAFEPESEAQRLRRRIEESRFEGD